MDTGHCLAYSVLALNEMNAPLWIVMTTLWQDMASLNQSPRKGWWLLTVDCMSSELDHPSFVPWDSCRPSLPWWSLVTEEQLEDWASEHSQIPNATNWESIIILCLSSRVLRVILMQSIFNNTSELGLQNVYFCQCWAVMESQWDPSQRISLITCEWLDGVGRQCA